jgi:hypothetical protein
LKGASIHYIGFEIHHDAWHIGIAHPALEPIVQFGIVPRIGLDPKVSFVYPAPTVVG